MKNLSNIRRKRKSKRILGIQIISSVAGLTAVASVPAAYFGYSAVKQASADASNSKAPPSDGPWAARQQDASLPVETFANISRNYSGNQQINDGLSNNTFEDVKQAFTGQGLDYNNLEEFGSFFLKGKSTESSNLTSSIFYDIVKANVAIYDHYHDLIFNDVQKLIPNIFGSLVFKDDDGNYGKIENLSINADNIWYQSPTLFNFDINYKLNFSGKSGLGPVSGMIQIGFKPTNSSKLIIDPQGNVSLTRTIVDLYVHTSVDVVDKPWHVFVYTNLNVKDNTFSNKNPIPYNNFVSGLTWNWTTGGQKYDQLQSIPGMPLLMPLYSIINDPKNDNGYFESYDNWFFAILLNFLKDSSFDIKK